MRVSEVALLVSQSGGKAVLEVAGRPIFELNCVAALIWEKLAGGFSTQEIIGHLITQFNIPEERAANDVNHFLQLLRQHLLLSDDVQFTGE